MSSRARVGAIVAAAAALAAGIAVGAAALQSRGDPEPAAARRPGGAPPALLEPTLGTKRADPLQREVAAAMRAWPDGTVKRLRSLVRAHPRRAVVRLNLGVALFWGGRRAEAARAWRSARGVEPDSLSAVRADDLLHPRLARGLPQFVPSFEPPRALAKLPPAHQLQRLRHAAEASEALRPQLLLGVALQRLGRPVSARQAYARAARQHPREIEARVADAVGRFTKDHPERAFSRLGPLVRRHGRSPTVRFHLGLLLLWVGELDEAKRQLALARDAGSETMPGREAARYLERLERAATR